MGIDLLPILVASDSSRIIELTDDDIKLNPGDSLSITAVVSASTTTADFNIVWKELF